MIEVKKIRKVLIQLDEREEYGVFPFFTLLWELLFKRRSC